MKIAHDPVLFSSISWATSGQRLPSRPRGLQSIRPGRAGPAARWAPVHRAGVELPPPPAQVDCWPGLDQPLTDQAVREELRETHAALLARVAIHTDALEHGRRSPRRRPVVGKGARSNRRRNHTNSRRNNNNNSNNNSGSSSSNNNNSNRWWWWWWY